MASFSVLLPLDTALHLGAHQPHAEDIGRLPADVFLAHVDDALQPQHGADRRRGHAVLAGAGLGDDAALAHPFGQQPLPQGVVDLVRAGVGQVFAFEEDPGAAAVCGQPLGQVERRRPAGEVSGERSELIPESGVGFSCLIGLNQLIQGRHQRLGHKAPAVFAKVSPAIR